MGVWIPFLHTRDRLPPCLSDPVALVALHLVFVGVLFLFVTGFLHRTIRDPWYRGSYLFLFFATLLQYFVTFGSSPGYVIDAMKDACDTNAVYRKTPATSKQPASSKNESLIVTVEVYHSGSGGNLTAGTVTSWAKSVLDMYPTGTSTSLHEQNIVMIVIDVFFSLFITVFGWEHVLARVTIVNFGGTYMKRQPYESGHSSCTLNACRIICQGLKDAIIILLLVILTISLIFVLLLLLFHSYLILLNQTTYELVRRRCIPYLRNIPERVHTFSRGIRTNLYNFCCAHHRSYCLEPLPTTYELEEKSRPYTCLDLLKCRCC